MVCLECGSDHHSSLRLANRETMKGVKNWDSAPSCKADADVDHREAEAVRVHNIDILDSPKEAKNPGWCWRQRCCQVPKSLRHWNLRHTDDVVCRVRAGIGRHPC